MSNTEEKKKSDSNLLKFEFKEITANIYALKAMSPNLKFLSPKELKKIVVPSQF